MIESAMPQFVDAAIGAVDALRIFAHNTRLEEATFEAATEGADATLREIIQFRSTQCWGDVIRNRDGLVISVVPIVGKAEAFVARRLSFPRRALGESMLFTTSTEDMIADGGRTFITAFAQLIDIHQAAFELFPIHFGGDFLIMLRKRSQEDIEHISDVDKMASGLNAALAADRLFIHLQNPALDVPGSAVILNQLDRIVKTGGKHLPDRMNQLDQGAKRLPPALRFELVAAEYPMTFEVSPHRYSLEDPENPLLAKTIAHTAAARIAVRIGGTSDLLSRYDVTILVRAFGRDHQEVAGAAANLLIADWQAVMPGEPLPLINDKTVVAEVEPGLVEIELKVSADRDSAQRYADAGEYELRPE